MIEFIAKLVNILHRNEARLERLVAAVERLADAAERGPS